VLYIHVGADWIAVLTHKTGVERFKIDIEYSCTFCGNYDETICHLFYGCTYCKTFWRDVENYIRRKTGQTLTLRKKYVFIYFEDGGTTLRTVLNLNVPLNILKHLIMYT